MVIIKELASIQLLSKKAKIKKRDKNAKLNNLFNKWEEDKYKKYTIIYEKYYYYSNTKSG